MLVQANFIDVQSTKLESFLNDLNISNSKA